MASPPGREELPPAELRRRAFTGALGLVGRGTAVRGFGLLTNLVLARILTPRDFGVLAIGLTIVALGDLVVSGSLGAGLVRRREPPSRIELQSVLALQLMLGVGIAALTAAVALPFGRTGEVTAIMVLALPITCIRTAGIVHTERQLRYGPIVGSEVLETALYGVAAIAAALAGLGVYGVAVAGVLRALVGTGYVFVAVPEGRMWPRLDWAAVRPIVRFGAQFQAGALVAVARDQALNVGLAGIGGLTVLGLWGLASRMLQIPMLLFQALWRVSFPAVARLLDAGEEVIDSLRDAAGSLTLMVGIMLAPLAASAGHLIPLLFGERWTDAAPAVSISCAALILSGPVSVVSAGFLYARGDGASVLRGVSASAVVTVVVSLVAVALSGSPLGVGIGQAAGAVTESFVFARADTRHGFLGVLNAALPCAYCSTVAAVCGWLVARDIGSDLLGTIVAVAFSAVALLGLVRIVDPVNTRATVQLGRRRLRAAFA